MAETEVTTTPAGAQAGQPASGGTTPAADAAPNKAGDEERLALRQRAIEAERKAAKLEDAQKKADDLRLAEQGKFQELAKAKEAEAMTWQAKYAQERRQNALIAAGVKAGIKDTDFLVLAKLGDVDVSDEGALREAADAAIGDLKKSKPLVFGEPGKSGTPFSTPNVTPGGGSNFDPRKVAAGDVDKLTKEQRAEVAKLVNGASAQVDYLGRPIR